MMIKMVQENIKGSTGHSNEEVEKAIERALISNNIDEDNIINITFRKPTCVNIFYRSTF